MYSDIDLNILDTPDFKEDSVREVFILPLLKRLGYSVSGENKIIRSKTLSQPFIYVGTKKHPVNIIPDYLLYHKDIPVLVLDAKSPTEDVLERSHIQQAYSYAVHPEIRCKHFALCNGRKLVVFSTEQAEPILIALIQEFNERWSEIEKYLLPKYLIDPGLREFAPDFGLSIKNLGLESTSELIFIGARLNLFAKVSDNLYSASANCEFLDKPHCASFDFLPSQLDAILAGLPNELSKLFKNALSVSPFQAAAELAVEVDISTHLGEETFSYNDHFIPLIIDKVINSRFNIEPLKNEPSDIPEYVFRLRKAFEIKE